MTKFSTYVGDASKFHDTAHGAIKAAVRLATRDDDMMDTMTEDDWSPEARAAALASRNAHAASERSLKHPSIEIHKGAASMHDLAAKRHSAVHNDQIAGMHEKAAAEHRKGNSDMGFHHANEIIKRL